MTEDKQVALFGKYQLLDRLAAGGMAEIFLARTKNMGGVARTCVIKRILPERCADRHFVSLFIDEARIMIGLDHPNVVKLLDFGQISGAYFMALEYVNGFDLVAILTRVAKAGLAISPLPAAYVCRSIAAGLSHAHHLKDYTGHLRGVVHRDISPHNVLISYLGEVKITDFGIALSDDKLTHTVPGTVMGKFSYMSPEQALARDVDARSDLFSLGVVLHEALTGRRLFNAKSPLTTLTQVLEAKIDPPSSVVPNVPRELDKVCLKALRRDPNKRYQEASQIVEDLDAVLNKQHFGRAEFAEYLNALDLADAREVMDRKRREITVEAQITEPNFEHNTELKRLRQLLLREPSIWILVAIGEQLLHMGERVRGTAAIRVAAALFAHRGLLVQAIVALEPIRLLCDENARQNDLRALAKLRDGALESLRQFVQLVDGSEAYALMREADPDGLGSAEDDATVLPAQTPLLGYVSIEDFARLVEVATIQRFSAGDLVIREAEAGDALFAIGRGRVVVYCDAPNQAGVPLGDDGRIYLSSLAEGDFFGEFGFLTGAPRSATVETISESWMFSLGREAIERVVELTPEIAGALLDFYKERVAELLMAKSPVFAPLDPYQRKLLLAHAKLTSYADGETIVQEGEASGALFFIKRGEVEIFSERQGLPIFLNKLAEGDFFGEIGLITGGPRTASVGAIGQVELLRIDRSELLQIMTNEPRVAEAIQQAAADRGAESAHIIADNMDILGRL